MLSGVHLASRAFVLCWYSKVSNWLMGAGMTPGRLFRANISRALVWIAPDLLWLVNPVTVAVLAQFQPCSAKGPAVISLGRGNSAI